MSASAATTMEYYSAVIELTKDVLAILALTLGVESNYFDPLTDGAPKDEDEKLNRGIGAHKDFGCVTLLQDEVDDLQVFDAPTGQWLDVKPVPEAYVVNQGNLFMRMANDKYKSYTHQVTNKSSIERYSIPFFLGRNPDYFCKCLPNRCETGEMAKYSPITVQDMVTSA
ncbi:hypothetical protein N7495_006044 [Penicillium taxi]|uniref:uncharacterized protein n=1 Tax=Penicillium taxi TaxID=168475 RepID=UPI002545B4F7|nr:uncharacterized protein N7495_006044 [Penicillium taxi]KAJ5894353.1 hypothetical protein N7495_006044 [Penicillium taxi]